MTEIHAAQTYTPCDDLWIIAVHFNPCHYRSRLANYHLFSESLRRSGLHLLTMECAFGEDDFELPASAHTVRVRSRDVLWQRERLLNLALDHMPAGVDKIAWVDADMLFSNPDWAVETSALLDRYPAVQPFEQVIRLSRGSLAGTLEGTRYGSFGYLLHHVDPAIPPHMTFPHGVPGFAWAYRRELIERHGFYDVYGDRGDHLMAHAMTGDFESPCLLRVFNLTPVEAWEGDFLAWAGRHLPGLSPRRLPRVLIPHTLKQWTARRQAYTRTNRHACTHYMGWARAFYEEVQGRVGYTPGFALHLWHGEIRHRRYDEIRYRLITHDFDPGSDVRISPSGCWEWASDKPELHRWMQTYFYTRREDGG
jgi:hypothetical protein